MRKGTGCVQKGNWYLQLPDAAISRGGRERINNIGAKPIIFERPPERTQGVRRTFENNGRTARMVLLAGIEAAVSVSFDLKTKNYSGLRPD